MRRSVPSARLASGLPADHLDRGGGSFGFVLVRPFRHACQRTLRPLVDEIGEGREEIVHDRTVNDVALVLPNLTALAPVRFAPEIVTSVPPAVDPLVGVTDDTIGAGGAT